MSADDALIFPLVIGPYALIVGLAWWRRWCPGESRILLVTVTLVMAYGFWAFGTSCYRRFSIPSDEVAMDLSPLVAPAIQFLVAAVLGLIMGVAAMVRSLRH